MSETLLSLCVIAKNEEATLERCLISSRGLVDEIVVVDTGSADGTISLAERLGARVFSHPWEDDFAAARNAALAQARSSWILVVDADESVSEADPEGLRRLLRDALAPGGPDAFSIRIDNVLDGGGVSPFVAVRLFRRRPEIRYRGRIHEEVTSSLAEIHGGPVTPAIAPIALEHDGYRRDARLRQRKDERNLRLLRRALKTDSRQAMLNLALARELLQVSGERIFPGVGFSEALSALERARESASAGAAPAHLVAAIDATLGAALTADGRPADALELLATAAGSEEAEQTRIEFVRARAILAAAGNDSRRLNDAVSRFKSLEGRTLPTAYTDVDRRITGVFAMERRAEAMARLENAGDARELLERAQAEATGYAGPSIRLAEIELLEGRVKEGLRAYADALQVDDHDPEAWLGTGRVMRVLNEIDQANECIDNALRLVPLWGAALLERAVTRFLCDRADQFLVEQSIDRDRSAEADASCLVAEILLSRPVSPLGAWPTVRVERALNAISHGIAAGRRNDLLAKLRAGALR